MGVESDYYVYVYIDPRNFEEFYFGKGRGSRKNAHLFLQDDSEKTKRIALIKTEGLSPIIRVIASNLSEYDALLVEKTLLWKLGKQLTNISSGHYAKNFRPHNTLHLNLSGFDFENGIYYYNVGEGPERHWDDCRELGFISAGQGIRWRDALLGFKKGDIFTAYLKKFGYVGVGKILEEACPVRNFFIEGQPLINCNLRVKGMAENIDSDDLCEYVCRVKWLSTVNREHAKWIPKSNIYTTTHVRASLDGQPETIKFLNESFNINLNELRDSIE